MAPIVARENDAGEKVFVLRSEQVVLEVSPTGTVELRLISPEEIKLLTLSLNTLLPGLASEEDHEDWETRGWKSSDGAQFVLLTKRLGHPLRLSVSHVLQLPLDGKSLTLNTRVTALAPSEERAAPLTLNLPLPADTDLWLVGDQPGECGSWAPAPLGTTSTDPRLAFQSQNALLLWSWRHTPEAGAKLEASVTVLDDSEGTRRAHFVSQLADPLPAQGWTLVSELQLNLFPITDTHTPCFLLRESKTGGL